MPTGTTLAKTPNLDWKIFGFPFDQNSIDPKKSVKKQWNSFELDNSLPALITNAGLMRFFFVLKEKVT